MRKTFFTHLFIWCVVLGFAFTAVAQDNSAGKVPMITNPTVNYTVTTQSPDLAGTAYGWGSIIGQFLSMPIPAGTPFTNIAPMTAPGFLSSATFGPTGILYFTDTTTDELYTVNVATGALTLVGSTGGAFLNGITYDWSNGTFYGVSATSLYTVDVTTGATTLVGALGNAGGLFIDVAVDCAGAMYGYDLGDDSFYSINKATGAATVIGAIGFDANFGQGLSYDHSDGTLYMSAFNNTAVTGQLRSVDVTTGATTLVFDWGFEQVAPFAIDQECGGGGTVSISYATEDLDMDFIPDHLGETVTIEGTISSPNYNTGNFNYVIHDGTGGITSIFFGYTGPEYIMGDVVEVTGVISQFRGLTQIEPLDDASVVLTGTGGALPDYTVLTIAQFLANAEMYEGELIAFVSLTAAGGGDPWPSSGSNANFNLTDMLGVDTLVMRIDKETDLDENPEPVWPKDVIGFGGQFTFATPPNDGYQVLARMYSEILPPGTVPVELTSFIAQVSSRVVTLNWTTATELNNQMFEIERKSEDGQYIRIGYVNGHGTTSEPQEYSYIDNTVEIGTYFYRLKQIDFGGRYAYSDVVHVDVEAPVNFALEQNYPNPFNPSTKITFSLAINSKVSLKVFDVLGQEITNLVTSNMTAGVHEVNFNAVNLNSGVYFYRIDATGVDGTNFTSVKKMILTK